MRFQLRREGSELHEDIESVLFSEQEIKDRVIELGEEITDNYRERIENNESVVAVCLLRGASIFMADLIREIKLPVEMDFMTVSSYGNSAKSSGVIRIKTDLGNDIEGKHVLIVEDIVDSGLTLNFLRKNLASRKPASLEIATLLKKDVKAQANTDCDYIGFLCPDDFVVGYGLDYAQRYRNLPYIGLLKPEVYE